MNKVHRWFSSDYCNISGKSETIPSSYDYYCKNGGYKCPWYEKEYGSSGCFITTITYVIKSKKIMNPVMVSLRKFRDEILQKNDKYSNVSKMCNPNRSKKFVVRLIMMRKKWKMLKNYILELEDSLN